MGVFSWLGATKTIPDTVRAVGDLYTTDKARIEAEAKLAEALNPALLQQLKNNETMLNATTLFSTLWQPLIGWTAGFLVLLYYAPQIIIATYVWGNASVHSGIVSPFPLKPDDILNLIYLLFGFGGYTLVSRKFK